MADRKHMGKGELVRALQDDLGYSRRRANQFVNIIVRAMKDALMVGMPVKIDGLGTLTVVHQKYRRRRIGFTPNRGSSIYDYRPITIKLTKVKLKLEDY